LNSALEYYCSTTQRYNNLDLISKKILNNQKIRNTEIEFHKVKEDLFFGYKKINIDNTEVFISNIEKTIIDCIYFERKVHMEETFNFIRKNLKSINIELIETYLNKINSSTINKRIGYLMDLNNIHLKNLKINNKYEKLNSNLGDGKKDKKWKLIINEDL
jgi:predicted transcriptional regulator of viral defense system